MKPFKVALVNRDSDAVPDWVADELAQAGIDFVVRHCVTSEDLAQCAGDADVVWYFHPNRVLSAEDLELLPRCGAILRTGSGTDKLPKAEATERGIVVANTPEAVSDAVSDHAVGMLLAVVRQLVVQDRKVRSGAWAEFNGCVPRLRVRGQTLGLVGFGHIARLVARKMSGFDMTTLVYDPFVEDEVLEDYGARAVELDALLSQSDFVSLHCPLMEATYHLIGERELRLMKPTAILINTARGKVVDEPALVRALTEGWIAGAGLDVFEKEPAAPDNPLWALDNVVVTSHIASTSQESADASWRLSVETAIALAQGRWPRSYVNPEVKPRWNLT